MFECGVAIVVQVLAKLHHFRRTADAANFVSPLLTVLSLCAFVEGEVPESAKRLSLRKSTHKELTGFFGNVEGLFDGSAGTDGKAVEVLLTKRDLSVAMALLELGLDDAKRNSSGKKCSFKIADLFDSNLRNNRLHNCLRLCHFDNALMKTFVFYLAKQLTGHHSSQGGNDSAANRMSLRKAELVLSCAESLFDDRSSTAAVAQKAFATALLTMEAKPGRERRPRVDPTQSVFFTQRLMHLTRKMTDKLPLFVVSLLNCHGLVNSDENGNLRYVKDPHVLLSLVPQEVNRIGYLRQETYLAIHTFLKREGKQQMVQELERLLE